MARSSREAFGLMQTAEPDQWEMLLRSACSTLACTPEALMKSIGVTGRLNGVEGEALYVLTLSKQLAAEYGLKEVVEMHGHSFTARFWRRDPEVGREGEGL